MGNGVGINNPEGIGRRGPLTPVVADRAPTANDIEGKKQGQIWVDQVNDAVYCLSSRGNWQLLGGGSVDVATLTGDSGGAISPSSGNITLAGGTAITSVGSGSTITFNADIASANQVVEESSNAVVLSPNSLFFMKEHSNVTCRQSPVLTTAANTAGVATGATGAVNLMHFQGESMEQFIMGAGQTIIGPRMDGTGLLTSLDLTNNEGAEYNWGARVTAKNTFTAGTDDFFLEWNFRIADVTGADPIGIGFRKVEANNGTMASYTDFCFIGVSETDNSGTISIITNLNGAGASVTDTTDAWADGETHRLRINVAASGAATFLIDGVAPTATAAFTFDATDVIMPFFHLLHGATAPGEVHWIDFSCGPL